MSLDDLPLRHVLNETADVYEILAALPPSTSSTGGRRPGKPGSKVPPGVGELLDIEEHERAISTVDEWAMHLARHLVDITPGAGALSDTTPGRLRFAASWADKLEDEEDLFARYAFRYDAVENLKALRRLVRRSNRTVRTGSACMDVTCRGTYTATVDGPEVTDELTCSRCGDKVPRSTWERWGARSEWVTVAHAANMLGITENAVYLRASRGGWRRRGSGREVQYRTEDVAPEEAAATRRAG